MENPIKENRLACDYSFAKRLLSFAEQVSVADACSFDEKESFIFYAEKLLRYQCLTATCEKEIAYLKRVNVYEKYTAPLLTTEDNVVIGKEVDILLFSCMKNVRVGEQILQHNAKFFNDDTKKPNEKRVYFVDKQKCIDYLNFNIPIYSERDLEVLLKQKRSNVL